jgi:four helix bundle protein
MSDFKTYKDLDIYNLALQLFLEVHPVSLKLPRYELYELGSQLRRASDSVVTNIVEGYGRRKYKADYVRFLIFSHSSCLETINHLNKLATLYPDFKTNFNIFEAEYEKLGGKIYNYIRYINNS